jgi:hypothetical protein
LKFGKGKFGSRDLPTGKGSVKFRALIHFFPTAGDAAVISGS